MAELEALLRSGGVDATALTYVRSLKRNNLTGAGRAGAEALGHGPGGPAASQGNLLDWADKTFGQGLSQVAKGVKTLLSGEPRGGAAWRLDAGAWRGRWRGAAHSRGTVCQGGDVAGAAAPQARARRRWWRALRR
jgi:hypothetical protein